MSWEVHINLHPVNLVIISGIFQTIVLSAVLLFRKKGNRYASRFIALFILICSLHFSWSIIIDTNLADIFKFLLRFPYTYLLAMGPLLFFYTKALTIPGYKLRSKELIHFVPVAVEFLLQLLFIGAAVQSSKVHYDVDGFLWFRILEIIATAISIFIYAGMSLRLIRNHEVWVSQNFSNQQNVTLEWLYQLIRYLRILWFFWLAFELSFTIFLEFQLHFIPVYLLLYILLGIVTYSTYWIGIQGLIKSEVLIERPVQTPQADNFNAYLKISEGTLNSHAQSLDQLMSTEKLFLHETLTLRMLSERLNLEQNLVSHVLNNVMHQSFYDYVNGLRVEEVKRKMSDPALAHLKIVEIAYECGFNSKATFNRVFKKVTGVSPSQYKSPS